MLQSLERCWRARSLSVCVASVTSLSSTNPAAAAAASATVGGRVVGQPPPPPLRSTVVYMHDVIVQRRRTYIRVHVAELADSTRLQLSCPAFEVHF